MLLYLKFIYLRRRCEINVFSNTVYIIKYIIKINIWCPILFLFLAFINSISSLVGVFSIKIILDMITIGRTLKETLIVVGWLFVTLFLLRTISSIISNIVMPLISESITKGINYDFFNKKLSMNLNELDNPNFYDEYYYIVENFKSAAVSTIQNISLLISSIITSSILIYYLSSMDISLLIITCLGVFGSFVFSMITKKLYFKLNIEKVSEDRKMSYINRIFYLKDYMNELKMFSTSDIFFNKYEDSYNNKIEIIKKHGIRILIPHILQSASQDISYVLTISLLVYNFFIGKIIISNFVTSLSSTQQLSKQISSIMNIMPTFFENGLIIQKYRNFFHDNDTEITYDKNIHLEFNNVKLNNICFSYPNESDHFSIKNINIDISKNKKIAIVGKNGAGKSTLAKIICFLYLPTSGEVVIDDKFTSNIDVNYLHSKVGIVFQDYKLFSFTVAENILMRKCENEKDEEIVKSALKFTGLYEKISELPLGIYTSISKEFNLDGLILSGGEQQKMALSRVFAQNYDLIIFDEITSAYDPIAENEIYKLIDEMTKNKSVIFISHRLQNMEQMDHIIYLENGIIIEEGSHSELLKRKNKYYDLYDAQASKYSY